MTPTVLLTGFEPFGEDSLNPSFEAVRLLARQWNGPANVIVERLPVVFSESGPALESAIDEHNPDVVVSVGLSGGRARVTPELIAINWDDARIPDNAGDQPRGVHIDEDGPAAYFTGLAVDDAIERVRAQGIPCALSTTAGTYVCNHVFYVGRQISARREHPLATGFVHVPYAPEQVTDRDLPSLPIDLDARAVGEVVAATLAAMEAGRDSRSE